VHEEAKPLKELNPTPMVSRYHPKKWVKAKGLSDKTGRASRFNAASTRVAPRAPAFRPLFCVLWPYCFFAGFWECPAARIDRSGCIDSWIPHNASFGFLDLTPSILLLRQFWD
jgi:hypothetical protein